MSFIRYLRGWRNFHLSCRDEVLAISLYHLLRYNFPPSLSQTDNSARIQSIAKTQAQTQNPSLLNETHHPLIIVDCSSIRADDDGHVWRFPRILDPICHLANNTWRRTDKRRAIFSRFRLPLWESSRTLRTAPDGCLMPGEANSLSLFSRFRLVGP